MKRQHDKSDEHKSTLSRFMARGIKISHAVRRMVTGRGRGYGSWGSDHPLHWKHFGQFRPMKPL